MLINSAAAPTLAAIAIQLILGLAVFQANPLRKANQCFLLLSLVVGLWLGSLYLVFSARNTEVAEFYIRQASAAAALIITAGNLLRLSIQKQNRRWRGVFRDSWLWLITALAIVAFCQTKSFLVGARFSHLPGALIALPVPIYGERTFIYVLYLVIGGLALLFAYARDAKQARGIRHAEFAFILTGAVAAFVTALVSFGLGFIVDRSRLVWFAPFRTLLFSLIVAYGIATQKIMDVGFFLRRAMSYILLTAYLLAIYGVVWWLVFAVFNPLMSGNSRSLAHMAAAVVVAFAMAPARGISQSFANRLFMSTRGLDFRSTMNKATAILRSVTTLRELLERFGKTIAEAVDTERVFILLPSKIGYAQLYPPVTPGTALGAIELSHDQAIIAHLEAHPEPIVLDQLHRVRATRELARVTKQMESLQIAVAMGIFSREHLAGVMLLGARLSGRIYGSMEQNALQVLCGQLAIAIDNAQLFTEVQNAKIYNEILLQNLTTGVIAADADGRISVFNHEAEQITGLKAEGLLEQPIVYLPTTLQDLMRETLEFGRAAGESGAGSGIGRRQRGRAREQFHLSWTGWAHAGRPRGFDRHYGAKTPRNADSPQRSPCQSRHSFRRDGSRDQKPARFHQDFCPAAAGTLPGFRFSRDFLDLDRA